EIDGPGGAGYDGYGPPELHILVVCPRAQAGRGELPAPDPSPVEGHQDDLRQEEAWMRPAFSTLAALGLLLTTLVTGPALAQELSRLAAQSDEDMASSDMQRPRGERQPARPRGAFARLASTQFPTIYGSAVLQPGSEGRTAVTVTVYGLEPGSTHVNHIH